ncbi:hypothetical protein ACJDU8_04430 [Clostridium sp. WILCCON 0269]|uniref:Phage protein n=1 Tax=Candidatus Clostridium eludens TaxID=3381663 RepID=A0ABW8SGH8_9CLOT
MFNDTKVDILSGGFDKITEAYIDIQPYDKSIMFEDGIEINVTKRGFCDIIPLVNMESYIKFQDKLYKVMKIKTWSDYMELWLYECERDNT